MLRPKDRIYSVVLMTHIIFQGPYILLPKDRIYSVFLMTHTISQGPYILRPKDRIFYALRTVYFTP